MPTLILRLARTPQADDAVYDYVLSADGSTVTEHATQSLAQLPLPGKAGLEVVALVAACHLSWHKLRFPAGVLGRRGWRDADLPRVRAALEGLLEERLLDDVQQLHFAIGPRLEDDGTVWVAACDRAWLRTALAVLEQSGRTVHRVLPEFSPELLRGVCHVTGFAHALLNVPEADAVNDGHVTFCSASGLVQWPLCAATVAALNWPASSTVVAGPALAMLAEQHFKRRVEVLQTAQRYVQTLGSEWNLAQFDLANSQHSRRYKRWATGLSSLARAPQWRTARVAALLVLLVNVLGVNAVARKEARALQAERVEVRQVLSDTFPKVTVVVDARAQMVKELRALQQASGALAGHDLESLLARYSASATQAAVPSAIDFVAGELRLRGVQIPAQDQAALTQRLQAQGLDVRAQDDGLAITARAQP